MPGEALRSLLVAFGIDVDDKQLEKGKQGIDGLIGKAKEAGKVLLEAFAVEKVREFFSAQIEGAAHVQDLAERLDVSATSIRKFGFAAQTAGVDIDSAAHSLGFLQKNLGDAEKGGGDAAQTFHQLKVPIKDAAGNARPLNDVILDIADGMQKLPDQNQRAAAAMKIFGRESRAMVPIFAKGAGAMRDLFAQAEELSGGIGDDYYEAAKKAREESERFAFAFQSIKMRITSAALPAINKLLDWLKSAARVVIDVDKRFNVFSDGLTFLGGFAGVKAVGVLVKLARVFGLLKPSVWETVLAFGKFLLPLALIAALVLVVQDLWTWMRGGKSVIGDVITQMLGFQGANDLLGDLRDVWDEVVKAFEPMIPDLEEAAKGIAKAFVETLPYIVTFAGMLAVDIVAALDNIVTTAREAAAAIASVFESKEDAARTATEALKVQEGLEKRGATRDKTRAKLDEVMAGLANRGGTAGALAGAQAQADSVTQFHYDKPGSSPVTQNLTQNITVNSTSTDPKAHGKAVGQGAASGVAKANYNAYRGLKKP